MKRWLQCTLPEAYGLIAHFDNVRGYPTDDGSTRTYTEPKRHPDPSVSDVMIVIEEDLVTELADEAKARLVDTEELWRAGWFHAP